MATDPRDRIRIVVESGKATITILSNDTKPTTSVALTREKLLSLIHDLGNAHSEMIGPNIPKYEHQIVNYLTNTRWYIDPEVPGAASALSFYHTSFGPVGFLLPIHEAERLAKTLALQVDRANNEGKRRIR
jgi:hypothetical protein